jgi:predicted SprT family Zn-dependent metalloprotease
MEQWMAEAYTKMDAPELIGEIPWYWNPKLTATMGQAHYRCFAGVVKPLKMDFAPRLFKRASEEEQRQTVYHECAHIVDYHKGTYEKGSAHGPSWKRYMRMAGVTPKRTHNVMPVGRVEVWCLCRSHYITKKMRNRIKNGQIRRCRKCKSKIALVKPRSL